MPRIPDILNKVVLFQDLEADSLATLAPLLIARKFTAGTVIFRELDDSDALYIVEQGSVVVSKHVSDDVEMVLTRFTPGDFFGEMGLFDNIERIRVVQFAKNYRAGGKPPGDEQGRKGG